LPRVSPRTSAAFVRSAVVRHIHAVFNTSGDGPPLNKLSCANKCAM